VDLIVVLLQQSIEHVSN